MQYAHHSPDSQAGIIVEEYSSGVLAHAVSGKPRSRLSASHVAVCRQGIYDEYSVKYSKCRALNGILVSTVDRQLTTVDRWMEVEGLYGRRLRGLVSRASKYPQAKLAHRRSFAMES
eukprot:3340565-Pyramimonas_sp.AAC.1